MILRTAVVALLLVTAMLLQTALLPYVAVAGFRPDLLLLFTVVFALRGGAGAGVRIGFVAGLLTDLLLGQSAVGLSALVYVGAGYTVGLARPFLLPDSVTAPLALAFLASFLATAGYGMLSRLLGDERYTVDLVLSASLFVAFLNALLAPAAVATVRWLDEHFPVEGAGLIA